MPEAEKKIKEKQARKLLALTRLAHLLDYDCRVDGIGLGYMGRPIYSTAYRADATGPIQSTRKEEQ